MPAIPTAASGAENGSFSVLILALPLALLAYLIFSQRRRARREAKAQQGLQVGDPVMTRAGMFGSVSALEGPLVHVEIAPGVVVVFDRRAVIPGAAPATDQPVNEHDEESSDPADSPDTDGK